MDVNSFLFLLIIGWFFLIGIHIALVREKSVAGCLYGIISCIFHIPMLLAMLGYFPPPSALNEYMGIMAYLFIPASFLMMPIVFILIIVTLIKAPESRPTVPLFEMDAKEPQFDINSELIDAVVNDDIALVKELVSQGANPSAKNQSGYSAQDFARGHGYKHISKLFLEHSKNGNHKH